MSMGIPEKFARRLLAIKHLVPPINVESLVTEYAILEYDEIPIHGIDGVSVNIKVPGKQPKVIVNSKISESRQRFTLAHELGHIIIPWHNGHILVDRIYSADGELAYIDGHSEIEKEANSFAAELLMPSDWIKNELGSGNNLATIHKKITEECQVSPIAAALRIIDLHQSAVAFCETDILNVSHKFGQSISTRLRPIENGKMVRKDYFNIPNEHSRTKFNTVNNYHWWQFSNNESLSLHFKDDRTWKEILHQILQDVHIDNITFMKQSINGIIASENGVSKRTPESHTELNLFATCRRKLMRAELSEITKHPDFDEFLAKRIADFFAN